MSVQTESAIRLTTLKTNIENKTGATYTNLTEGINALIDGYGQDGLPEIVQPGDTPILDAWTVASISNTTAYEDTGAAVTIPKAGTYRFRVFAWGSSTYTYGTTTNAKVVIYKNNEIVSTTESEIPKIAQQQITIDLECNANDEIKLYAMGAASSYGGTGYGDYVNISANVLGFVVCVNK